MAITSKIYIPPIYDLMTENDLKRRETPHKTPPQGDHTRSFLGFSVWKYGWDGVLKSRGLDYEHYVHKWNYDRKALAAPAYVPLELAAEKWRSISEGREPDYFPVLDGCLMQQSGFPPAYVVMGVVFRGVRRLRGS